MSWIEDSITDYYKWLRERAKVRTDETTGWSVMSTPFLGAYNDPLEIYLRKDGDEIEMSDDGVTFENLNQLGVNSFFDKHDLVYTPQFITKGSTGIEFTFDFQFAGRKKETVVKSFNSLNKINVPNFLFTWNDIKPVREEQTGKKVSSLAIVNDLAIKLKPEYIEALKTYGCGYVPWSQKDSPETIKLFKDLVA